MTYLGPLNPETLRDGDVAVARRASKGSRQSALDVEHKSAGAAVPLVAALAAEQIATEYVYYGCSAALGTPIHRLVAKSRDLLVSLCRYNYFAVDTHHKCTSRDEAILRKHTPEAFQQCAARHPPQHDSLAPPTHSSTDTLQASGMCKPPTPDAMAAPDDVDVKGTAPDDAAAAPDAAEAEAEDTPPTPTIGTRPFVLR